jgi:DNA-directed RNA polymerase specialized sigma24 family protein
MLIRNDREFRIAQDRLDALRAQARTDRAALSEQNWGAEAISLATSAQDVMAEEIEWDIRLYQRLKAGEIEAVPAFVPEERGKALICLRLVKGWSQRQLADALEVSEAVVSRDEHNEYRGGSLEKYGNVLRTLGFEDHPRFSCRCPHAAT